MPDRDPHVLIVSNQRDSHVPLVSHQLDRLGVAHFFLDTEAFGDNLVGSFHLDRVAHGELRAGGRRLNLEAVTGVWYRRPEVPRMSAHGEPEAKAFAQHEQKAFLDGLLSTLQCAWISRPEAIRAAGHKVRQLALARELGFSTPPTLVSQVPEDIKAFRAAMGRPLIAKMIGKGPPRAATPNEQYVVFTQLLRDEELDDVAALSSCAALYQPYVEKQFELRVTVVGDESFACRIDSQASVKTRVDWRNYDFESTPHSAFSLDGETHHRCLELVRVLGLNFGAIDLIVTPRDDVVFLEINPNGQWGWIEELTGLPIAMAHARALANL